MKQRKIVLAITAVKNNTKYKCNAKARFTKDYDGNFLSIATSGEHLPLCLVNESTQRKIQRIKFLKSMLEVFRGPREFSTNLILMKIVMLMRLQFIASCGI